MRGTVMPRLLEVADLCSRTVSDPANRLRKTRKKKSSAVPLFRSGHMSAICARLSKGKGEIHKRVENRRLSTLLCARRAQRQHSRTPQRAKSSAVGTATPSTAVRRFPSPFRGGFRSVQTVLNDIYPLGNAKNRGQMPSVSCFIARYAKNYFFRTTSPPRPVCAVMYSRPILAYSNGLALAGSCSASTMIQPV